MSALPKRKAAAQAQRATQSQLAPRAAAAAAKKAASLAEAPKPGSWDTDFPMSELSELSEPESDFVVPTVASLLAHPLSGPPAPVSAPPAGPAAPRKRKAMGQDAGTKRSPKRAKKQPQQPAPEPAKPPRAEEAPTPVRPAGDVWSLMFLIMERYAFVRLGEDGNPTDGSKESSAVPGYWWPTKILSDSCKPPIEVQLFGDDGNGAARHVELCAPSEFNIVTTRRNSAAQRRFQQANFASPPTRFSNLCMKWSRAMDEYSNHIMGDDSLAQHVSPLPMPAPGTSSQPSSPTRKRAQPKPRKARAARTADTTIRLPGEKVLARKKDSTAASLHWPALVQQFQSKGAKYELLFHDDSRQWLARDYFFLRHEDGFSQCNVDMEMWGLEERDREFDDDDDGQFVVPARDRGMPSPPPELPSLPLSGDGSDYRALPVRAQVALVEHVLDLVINDKYAPARRRHRDFIKGRKAREMLAQTAGAKGSLTVDEQTQVREIVRKWALRDERWAKHIDDFGDVDGDGDADDEAPPVAARVPSPAAPVQEQPAASPSPPSPLPPPVESEAAAPDESMDVDLDAEAQSIAAVEDVHLDMRAMDDLLEDTEFAAPAPPAIQTFTGVMRSPTESAMHSPDLHYMPCLAPILPSSSGALGLAFGPDGDSQPVAGPSFTLDESIAFMTVDAEESTTSMAVDAAVATNEPILATEQTPAPTTDEAPPPGDGEDVAMGDSTVHAEAPLASQAPATDMQVAVGQGASEPLPVLAVPADGSAVASLPIADTAVSVVSPSAAIDTTTPPAASPLAIAANTALPPSSQPASLFAASSPPPTQPVTQDSPSSRADISSPVTQAADLDASSPTGRGSETAASGSASGSETHVDHPSPSNRVPHRAGCATYEALSESERNQYCVDVLAYEAVVQVLLWRSGKKTTVEPLTDPAAENALHDEGVTLANTYDHKLWVYEIADRRRKKDQMKPAPRKRETFSGKELRTALKVNYREDD
ncbi:hypothetical protein AURDEDRAFT_180698 [Auricularia subglabra TFB-10046 SS5]|nr:hypothetical protein AURDEDRAFT_180698 [Auricularia subglabra TFB-10046 SS5]